LEHAVDHRFRAVEASLFGRLDVDHPAWEAVKDGEIQIGRKVSGKAQNDVWLFTHAN
jgi:hypothetical protein